MAPSPGRTPPPPLLITSRSPPALGTDVHWGWGATGGCGPYPRAPPSRPPSALRPRPEPRRAGSLLPSASAAPQRPGVSPTRPPHSPARPSPSRRRQHRPPKASRPPRAPDGCGLYTEPTRSGQQPPYLSAPSPEEEKEGAGRVQGGHVGLRRTGSMSEAEVGGWAEACPAVRRHVVRKRPPGAV